MLYRFSIELSDVDRSLYQNLDFRVSQHPSEVLPYLLTRVLAYALSYEENLEFSLAGLSDPEVPALQALGLNSKISLWIEIGNPSARKLHKASKLADKVVVYTYKSAEVLISDIKNNDVHRAKDILIYAFESNFLLNLEKSLKKNNHWALVMQQGQIDITIGEQTISTEIQKKSVSDYDKK